MVKYFFMFIMFLAFAGFWLKKMECGKEKNTYKPSVDQYDPYNQKRKKKRYPF